MLIEVLDRFIKPPRELWADPFAVDAAAEDYDSLFTAVGIILCAAGKERAAENERSNDRRCRYDTQHLAALT